MCDEGQGSAQPSELRSRIVLNSEAAAEIYQYKLALITPDSFKSCIQKNEMKIKGHSTHLALKYGVTSKTIRDIWNRKSWISATAHLWEPNGKLEGSPEINVSYLDDQNIHTISVNFTLFA